MLTKAPHLFDDATRVSAGDSRWQGHTSDDYWAFVGPFGGATAATILRGAQERLVPILMTAAVTALGLLPLAIGLHQPGREIEGPMAVTVLGGLLSSTILNLMVLPALAERFGGPKRVRAAP